MIIYHGSDIAVTKPKIVIASRFLDFGEGFYTTASHEQAVRWAERVNRNRKSNQPIISIYDFDIDKAVDELQIIRFNTPGSEWLRFVTSCRSGKKTDSDYDIVMGPVANDNVYATVQLFETGILTEAETIIRLKVEKIYNQILFHTEKSLAFVSFKKYENAGENANEQRKI